MTWFSWVAIRAYELAQASIDEEAADKLFTIVDANDASDAAPEATTLVPETTICE